MPRKTMALVLALAVLTGCAGTKELRNQNANLTRQLRRCEDERDALENTISMLETDRRGLQENLEQARAESQQMSGVVERLQQEQSRLQQERQELQKLVRDLSGFSVETREEGNFIVVENDILFESGEADLADEATQSLASVAEYLKERRGLTIRVDGHTDAVPITHSSWEDNYHLSAMRAHSVMQYLAEQGVNRERMFIVGFGPSKPVVEPDQPSQPIAENRRVEILLVPEGSRSIEEILEGIQD